MASRNIEAAVPPVSSGCRFTFENNRFGFEKREKSLGATFAADAGLFETSTQ
jgi:hypothetical protein